MTQPRWNLVGVLAALLLLLSAACGSDGVEPVETATPSVAATTVAATTPSASASPSGANGGVDGGAASATPHVVVTASPDEPVASTAFIPASELPEAILTRADGTAFVLPIEVPDRSEYGIGLSGRLELGKRGMLFWYREPTDQGFWMQNTHYDLSIAFVEEDGTILEILDMEAESLKTRRPDGLYRYAIEAPRGWYDERGIVAGDRAVLDFEIPESLRGR